MVSEDAQKRINSALQLLSGIELSLNTFENIRTLVKGIHPGIDKKLEMCSKALTTLQKIQSVDIISLSAENLPEKDDEDKKRKKALLFFIQSIKDLKSEMQRVNTELQSQQNTSSQMMSWGRIIKFAKGPLGLVTLVALVLVVAIPFFTNKTKPSQVHPATSPVTKKLLQVITYKDKQLPLDQLYIGYGPDCDSPHYHATNGKVTALDGSIVIDPEGCGFGKVASVQVTTVEK